MKFGSFKTFRYTPDVNNFKNTLIQRAITFGTRRLFSPLLSDSCCFRDIFRAPPIDTFSELTMVIASSSGFILEEVKLNF
jgi:hypothetical protein